MVNNVGSIMPYFGTYLILKSYPSVFISCRAKHMKYEPLYQPTIVAHYAHGNPLGLHRWLKRRD